MARSRQGKQADLWALERSLRARGVRHPAGIDEVGRGPLAGPVVAAAVIFKAGFRHRGIRDSKQLTPAQREALVPEITGAAVAWALGESSPEEIDAVNILQATFRAMERAIAALAVAPDYLLVDGSGLPNVLLPGEGVVDGDGRVACIAAASILAKVHRDGLMVEHAARWPDYGFENHKGYGTLEHLAALAKHGPCPIHRRTFRGVLPDCS